MQHVAAHFTLFHSQHHSSSDDSSSSGFSSSQTSSRAAGDSSGLGTAEEDAFATSPAFGGPFAEPSAGTSATFASFAFLRGPFESSPGLALGGLTSFFFSGAFFGFSSFPCFFFGASSLRPSASPCADGVSSGTADAAEAFASASKLAGGGNKGGRGIFFVAGACGFGFGGGGTSTPNFFLTTGGIRGGGGGGTSATALAGASASACFSAAFGSAGCTASGTASGARLAAGRSSASEPGLAAGSASALETSEGGPGGG